MSVASPPRGVGDLLRDWRQRRRLSQLDLAVEANVSTRHLSFIETGRASPSREMVLLLARALDAIAARPGVRAADLAQAFGRETQPFKLDVRKLKNLGLTISLQTGYRLSPRGEAYLRHRRLPLR